jgi:hypothetical protein
MTDRVLLNTPDDWLGPDLELGAVDEIVLSDSVVHIESLSSAGAFISIRHRSGLEFRGHIHAQPTTWRQRRDVLRSDQDRLVDHLRSLLPRRWSHTWWAIPVRARPLAAWRSWREAAWQARAVLLITVDEDSDIDEDFTPTTGSDR